MDLSDYPVHHDPENVFGAHFDVVLDKDMASQRPGYKEGGLMVQPACIVLDSDGNEIYTWKLVPANRLRLRLGSRSSMDPWLSSCCCRSAGAGSREPRWRHRPSGPCGGVGARAGQARRR